MHVDHSEEPQIFGKFWYMRSSSFKPRNHQVCSLDVVGLAESQWAQSNIIQCKCTKWKTKQKSFFFLCNTQFLPSAVRLQNTRKQYSLRGLSLSLWRSVIETIMASFLVDLGIVGKPKLLVRTCNSAFLLGCKVSSLKVQCVTFTGIYWHEME